MSAPLRFFFTSAASFTGQVVIRASDRLQLSESTTIRTQFVHTGLPQNQPVSFAKATNGYVYMASGVDPMVKWDGIKTRSRTVGVAAPATALTLNTSMTGELTGRYTAYCRFIDDEGNVSNLSPISNEVIVEDIGEFNYTDVAVPTEQKVTTKQILRNTNGQAAVYYVDIDTTDLNQTTFVSTRTDADLRLQNPVSLFDASDRRIANLHGIPPDDKPLVVFYNDRLFALGNVQYEEGNAALTLGSATVTGIATEWTSGFAGRFLYVIDEKNSYEIDSVDVDAQTLTLTTSYRGTTNTLSQYVIQPAPANRSLIYWTEPGQFDSWPALNSLSISAGDDLEDNIVGAIVTQSFIYILQHRHIYRLSYLQDPLIDGGVFLTARRGCVNNRCWINVDNFSYLLDERGIYRFDGTYKPVEDLSQQIQDIFWVDQSSSEPFRINWSASRFFHAVHRRSDTTIRWFVAFSGDRYPRHALVLNYQLGQWWVEEYPWPIASSVELREQITHPVVSGNPGQYYTMGIGALDTARAEDGDTRGTVLSATPTSLTTSDMVLPVSGVVGAPVAIVSGRGKTQVRIVASVSGQTLRMTRPWLIQPDSTSVFQIGAISWRWKSAWMSWILQESNQARRVTTAFQPTKEANQFDMRIYRDYSETPEAFQLDWPRTVGEASGSTLTKGSPDAVFDLTQSKGYARLRLDDWKEVDELRGDLVAVELRGVGGTDPLKIYGMYVEGAQS